MYTLCEAPEYRNDNPYPANEPMTIVIENHNGSKTPVTLTPIGANQWKGPRGEIYDGLPGQSQLESVYGL